ncbi:hypothetical protein HDE_03955 [Halotydeus destructor]|nr:hypothetical protein HDE_03955 [Halotydeus destructor]
MASKLLLLSLAINHVLGQEVLNCHIERERILRIFPPFTNIVVEKCDRLILNIGHPNATGHIKQPNQSVLDRLIEAKADKLDLKVLIQVELRGEDLPLIAEDKYRDQISSSMSAIIFNKGLDGVVVKVEYNYQDVDQSDFITKKVISIVARLREQIGRIRAVGVVTGNKGPFNKIDQADCQTLANYVDFIELSAERIEHDKMSSKRSADPTNLKQLHPSQCDKQDEKAVFLTQQLIGDWLDTCDLLREKTLLTISPLAYGQQAGYPESTIKPFQYEDICNERLTCYEGADLPILTLEDPRSDMTDKYWLSFDNIKTLKEKIKYGRRRELAGFAFDSINSDDLNNVCNKGRLPFFTQLVNELRPDNIQANSRPSAQFSPSRIRPEAMAAVPAGQKAATSKLQEVCQLMTHYCKGI